MTSTVANRLMAPIALLGSSLLLCTPAFAGSVSETLLAPGGIRIEFILFALTLLGVALLHNVTTLGVALNAMRPHLPTKALPGEESHFESPASS